MNPKPLALLNHFTFPRIRATCSFLRTCRAAARATTAAGTASSGPGQRVSTHRADAAYREGLFAAEQLLLNASRSVVNMVNYLNTALDGHFRGNQHASDGRVREVRERRTAEGRRQKRPAVFPFAFLLFPFALLCRQPEDGRDRLGILDAVCHDQADSMAQRKEALGDEFVLLWRRLSTAQPGGHVNGHGLVEEPRTHPEAQGKLPVRGGVAGFFQQLAAGAGELALTRIDAPGRQLP